MTQIGGEALAALMSFGNTSDRVLRETLDVLPVAVYMTDRDGRLTYFNRAAAKLWGSTPDIGAEHWRLA